MDLTILSANLRRLRTARGMSQAELAAAAGLSRVGYRNIESGVAEPQFATLTGIADALKVRPQDLLSQVPVLRTVRFRARKRLSSRENILAQVALWLEAYSELEQLVGSKANTTAVAQLMGAVPSKRSVSRPSKAAALARRELAHCDCDAGSVKDIAGLLERSGIKVFCPRVESDAFFGLSVGDADGGPAVVVNVWERISVERWIFSAAHELGHLLLHRASYDVAKLEEDDEEEKEANQFASEFLMPAELFDRKVQEWRGLPLVSLVMKLKRFFSVSWKTVLHRLGERDPGVWPRFQVLYKRQTGRTLAGVEEPEGLAADGFRAAQPAARAADEPERLQPDDFIGDRMYTLVREAFEDGAITLGRAAEILRLDIGSMRELANSWVR